MYHNPLFIINKLRLFFNSNIKTLHYLFFKIEIYYFSFYFLFYFLLDPNVIRKLIYNLKKMDEFT